MSYLSVSTWSLHRLLGPLRWTIWDQEDGIQRTALEPQPEELTLLELPAAAAARGFQALEVCHFHFPSREPDYLVELRAAFRNAGIAFDTLLLDYGDLTSPDVRRVEADERYISSWIDAAALAGAKKVRVIAGEAMPTDEDALARSAASLDRLSAYAQECGVRIVTENFKPLTSTGPSCLKLMGRTERPLAMITDFGNFKGAAKYEELAMTLPRSLSVHAKAEFDEHGIPDEQELRLCLEAVRNSGYDGSYVIIYDGPGDMWAGIERVRRIVEPYAAG
ncbi:MULTISPECIES: TIM barrel protein [unclassified Paenibacillus]|uniref:sugar phosphate isomerase/epimerase family protein n=1 Tax=unclassified Paenibacillus TaxID=185978 RepID=UPI0009572E68|nr:MULTISPECIES: TIM barrel protein [unclassified Paenibacillus]ASS66033.1 TIM barrel protein [Paenibacillus sp. RUD330]SIQ14755.1 Sugar phosphate isomerase/epimerase [Paenibacillus sp. RU4X]SIQ36589.1 Sugar phosphate isomerase/epimerase [Paenibacillus sp. RU4T]